MENILTFNFNKILPAVFLIFLRERATARGIVTSSMGEHSTSTSEMGLGRLADSFRTPVLPAVPVMECSGVVRCSPEVMPKINHAI